MKEENNTKISFYYLVQESFLAGEKNLAIGSTGYHLIQKKILMQTINAITAAKPGIRFCIVSFYGESDFVDGRKILDFSNNELIQFKDQYDYIIWNLPDLEFLKNHESKFEKIFKMIDKFTILSQKPAGIDERDFFDYVKNYYVDHGFDGEFITRSSKKVEKKKKLLERITQLMAS